MLPRLVLISDSVPQSIYAGNIQLLRLLENYPKDKLLIIGRPPSEGATTLYSKYISLTFPLSDRLRLSRLSSFWISFEALGFIKYWLPKKVKKEIDDFQPEIILTLFQLYPYYWSAYKVARKKNLPLIVICHDDVERFYNLSSFINSKLVKKNKKIYQFASKRLCVSEEMVKEWGGKYKASGDVLYPIPSIEIVPRREGLLKQTLDETVVIGFAGSLAYGYSDGIKEVLPALKGTKILLHLYQNKTKDLDHPNIVFRGFSNTPEETWLKIQKECDLVILPYSFQNKYAALYSTHFPSKLSEYLMLGLPIVARGPQYATGIKWLKKNSSCNVVVETEDNAYLLEQIFGLMNHVDAIEKASVENPKNAIAHFSPNAIQKKFENFLRELAPKK